MHTDTLELIGKGQDLVRYLRSYKETAWADWLDQCLDSIRSGHTYGVYELLACYRGIAGIQDLYICPEAGHTVPDTKEIAVNEQLLLMVSRLHECARSVTDRLEREAAARVAARRKRRQSVHGAPVPAPAVKH